MAPSGAFHFYPATATFLLHDVQVTIKHHFCGREVVYRAMRKLRIFRLLFSLAALLFVAKPFLGFVAFNQQVRPRISHTILVKSFTKRKPESLNEANAKAEAVHQQLSNPLLILLSAISVLLAALLPASIEQFIKLTGRLISDIRTALLPPERAFLLAGKLTI